VRIDLFEQLDETHEHVMDIIRLGRVSRNFADLKAVEWALAPEYLVSAEVEWTEYETTICRSLGLDRLVPFMPRVLPTPSAPLSLPAVTFHEAEINSLPYLIAKVGSGAQAGHQRCRNREEVQGVRSGGGFGGAARKVGFWAGSPLLPYAEPISAGCATSFPGRKLDSKTAWAKGRQASYRIRCLRFLVRVVFQRVVAERRAEAAAQHPIGRRLVVVVVVRPGAHQGYFVHAAGHVRQQLADLQAGDVAVDLLVLAADLGRSLGLGVEAVVVRQPAAEEDEDDRLRPVLPRRGQRLSSQQGRQPQRPDGADAEEVAPRDAVTAGRLPAEDDVKHGLPF